MGLHETLLKPVPMYGSKTMLLKEKEKCRIRAVQMEKLRSLPDIRRMDKLLNPGIRELCGVTKELMKVFSGGSAMEREWRIIGILRWSK